MKTRQQKNSSEKDDNFMIGELKIPVNDETSPLILDIALDVGTTMKKSDVDLELKIPKNETPDTRAILILLNRLDNSSSNLKKTETMLESKIVPSFKKYYSSGMFKIVNGGAIGFGLLMLIVYISGIINRNVLTESDKNAYMIGAYIECAAFIISLTAGCISYRSDIRDNRTYGIFISRYETANPLSEKEASDIQNTLATIEYKDNISTEATGKDMRSAAKFLADAGKRIDDERKYLELRKNSLFKVLPTTIPEGVKAIVLEYAIDLEKDYCSKVLTFGSVTQ